MSEIKTNFTTYQQTRLRETKERVNRANTLLAERLATESDDERFPSRRAISVSAYVEYSLRKIIRRIFH